MFEQTRDRFDSITRRRSGVVAIADRPERWLAPTPQIDSDHPAIRRAVSELLSFAADDREAAVLIHDFVRDEVAFGWTISLYEMKASQVLRARRGYSQTKTTLFIAMLRAAGIPARPHFVDLRADILDGLMETGGAYVDHCYTEVWLDGEWIAVDSYIVDRELYRAARPALARSRRRLGLGVHQNGTIHWDGRSPSFIQFVDDGTVAELFRQNHGIFDDVADFYRETEQRWNRKTRKRSLHLLVAAPAANRRVDRLRREGAIRGRR